MVAQGVWGVGGLEEGRVPVGSAPGIQTTQVRSPLAVIWLSVIVLLPIEESVCFAGILAPNALTMSRARHSR